MLSLGFVSADLKPNKDSFSSGDIVYLISTSDPLCFTDADKVKFYIVEVDELSGGENLVDKRGESSEVDNKRFPREKVWDNAEIGLYNMVIDCNENGRYDIGEPKAKDGFEVVAKKGVGKSNNGVEIGDFSWSYDSEEIDLDVELLHFKISSDNENIKLVSSNVEFYNNPSLDLEAVEYYIDSNGDAKLDNGDVSIGSVNFEEVIANRGSVEVVLDYVLNAGEEKNLLVVYKLKDSILEGRYSMRVNSFSGVGEITGENINFLGFSRQSGVMTVLPAKSCLGSVSLELDPDSSYNHGAINAKAGNLSGCENRRVSFKDQPCYLFVRNIGNCELNNGECVREIITTGSKTYYACIDKNEDGDFVDIGESISTKYEFLVKAIEVVEEDNGEVNEEGNVEGNEEGGVENEGSGSISGDVVSDGGLKGDLINNDSFLVLLEVTLLLILFVLVMILFKLGGNARMGSKSKGDGGDDKDKDDGPGLLDDDDEDEDEMEDDDKNKKDKKDDKDIGDLFDEEDEEEDN
jgi:hypothetical protein